MRAWGTDLIAALANNNKPTESRSSIFHSSLSLSTPSFFSVPLHPFHPTPALFPFMTHSFSVHLNWLPLSSSSFFFTPRDLGTSFVQEGSELYLSLSRKSYLDSFRYLSGISELEDHLLGVAQALKQTRQLPIRERERGEEGARGREGERFECVRERDGKERERERDG